jgi:hypothetical protein
MFMMTAIWVVVAATGLSGGVALAAHAGPCAFDPPPGDIGQLPLINNTSNDLHFFECDPATCSSGFNLHPLTPAATAHVQYEQCTGASIGLTDTTGTLVGCLKLPQGEPAPIDHLSAAEATPCTPSTPEPVQPRIYTPH